MSRKRLTLLFGIIIEKIKKSDFDYCLQPREILFFRIIHVFIAHSFPISQF